jgi:hypothetical protein
MTAACPAMTSTSSPLTFVRRGRQALGLHTAAAAFADAGTPDLSDTP